MIKAVLIDDEPPARSELRRMLEAHEDVQVTGEAGTLETARGLLLRNRPDVVFLDINLAGTSGFDLLDAVDDDTAVVFATAYDEYAVRAFDASALDYLLKPIETARLTQSLGRVRAWLRERGIASESTLKGNAVPFTPRHWVFLDTVTPEFIEVYSIACIQAAHGSTQIITADGKTRTVERSLQEWQQRLPSEDFVMLHRSTLANLKHVRRVDRWSNYSYRVHIAGLSEPIIMSRRRAVRLRDLLA